MPGAARWVAINKAARDDLSGHKPRHAWPRWFFPRAVYELYMVFLSFLLHCRSGFGDYARAVGWRKRDLFTNDHAQRDPLPAPLVPLLKKERDKAWGVGILRASTTTIIILNLRPPAANCLYDPAAPVRLMPTEAQRVGVSLLHTRVSVLKSTLPSSSSGGEGTPLEELVGTSVVGGSEEGEEQRL